MDAKQIDSLLLLLLNELPYFSNVGTSLLIRLADHAAQLNCFRSTRQVNDNAWKDVDTKYAELVSSLQHQIYEATNYLNSEHTYKDSVFKLDNDEIINLLEDTLFEMTSFGSHVIFIENFFK